MEHKASTYIKSYTIFLVKSTDMFVLIKFAVSYIDRQQFTIEQYNPS